MSETAHEPDATNEPAEATSPTARTGTRQTSRLRARPPGIPDADGAGPSRPIILVAVEPVPRRTAGRSCSSCPWWSSSTCATSWPPVRGTGRGFELVTSPAATATRPAPTWRRTSSGSCSTASGRGCPAPRSRRWPSWRTSSRSRVCQVASIRGVDPDGVLRTLQARGYISRGRPRQRTRAGHAVRHHGLVPRASSGWHRWPICPPIAEFVPGPEVVEALEHGVARRPRRSRHSPVTDPDPDARQAEPPLWEQWAAASAALPQGERLQKVLAAWGWGSRRVCENFIAAGRVTVNGDVAVLGRRVDPEQDRIEVDGVPLGVRARAGVLPAQQADRRGDHRPRSAGATDGGRPGALPIRACSRSDVSTSAPRAC